MISMRNPEKGRKRNSGGYKQFVWKGFVEEESFIRVKVVKMVKKNGDIMWKMTWMWRKCNVN